MTKPLMGTNKSDNRERAVAGPRILTIAPIISQAHMFHMILTRWPR